LLEWTNSDPPKEFLTPNQKAEETEWAMMLKLLRKRNR
jgi:hypothetical protein